MKDTCYRYRAIPDKHWQSYFSAILRREENCEYFLRIEKGDNLQSLEGSGDQGGLDGGEVSAI